MRSLEGGALRYSALHTAGIAVVYRQRSTRHHSRHQKLNRTSFHLPVPATGHSSDWLYRLTCRMGFDGHGSGRAMNSSFLGTAFEAR